MPDTAKNATGGDADREELLDAHHHLTSLTRRLSGLEKDMLRIVEQRLKDLGPKP